MPTFSSKLKDTRYLVVLPAGSALKITADAGIFGHHVPSSLLTSQHGLANLDHTPEAASM